MKNYFKIFLPYLISLFFIDKPEYSYSIAWLGSFYIFYVTWVQHGKLFSDGLPVEQRIMRPIFIIQAVFAGYMCLTSVFYFYDEFEQYTLFNNNLSELLLTAKSQRLCLLGHIALVLGIVSQQSNKKISVFKTKVLTGSFYVKLAFISLIISIFFDFTEVINQVGIYANSLYTFSIAFVFICGIRENSFFLKIIGILGFFINIILASVTGMKEPIIIYTIIMAVMLYPLYKKTVLALSIPLLLILFYFLPMYTQIIRQETWYKGTSTEDARSLALDQILNEENEENIKETNWTFLTGRFSEVEMFNKYLDFVPQKRDYYYFDILINSVTALVPRVIWPSKPITEHISMERVYEAEVIVRGSAVSAKTRPIIDGYLSFGFLGAFLALFLYGFFLQWACNKAEEYFASYELGCIVIFNACFQALWRGNNFEFILNNIFFGFIIMWLIFIIFKKTQILIPNNSDKIQNSQSRPY